MLLDRNDVLGMLQCPKTGSPLVVDGNRLIANDSKQITEYELIDGYPVVVDFDNSVLQKEDIKTLSSKVERRTYGGGAGFIKRVLFPPKSTTARNVKRILDLVLCQNHHARVLIVGGGSVGQGMAPFYDNSGIDLVSFDIYASPSVQLIADAHNIPFSGESFDVVIIQAVLEHVLQPEKVVSELYRVLKKDGIVYAETPFLQHVHEGAYDFTRYTESGHRYLFREFELLQSGVSAGAGTQLLWSLDNFFRGLFRSRRVGKLFKILFFWLQYCDRLIPESYNIDSASGVFFMGKKNDSAISRKAIIGHYMGAQK